MHPIEHLYYYSCTALPLFFLQSPFHVLCKANDQARRAAPPWPWTDIMAVIFADNGQHAMLSPAESHSGWEDHNGADLMHYIHHAKFECNYVPPPPPPLPLRVRCM
jgi:hypothetical protein